MWKCCWNECGEKINATMFLCTKHWRALNKTDQRLIYQMYREYTEGSITVGQLRERQQAVLGERGNVYRPAQAKPLSHYAEGQKGGSLN
jgi:hypothetical protein